MNDQELNIAIAEACGWKGPNHPDTLAYMEGWHPQHWGCWALQPNGTIITSHRIPDYCNDLNALHKAEKMLKTEQRVLYAKQLLMLVGPEICELRFEHLYEVNTTTARPRAEALYRTLRATPEKS